MEVGLKNRTGQLYRAPPGYALSRDHKMVHIPRPFVKQPLPKIYMTDIEALCKSLDSAKLKELCVKQNVMEVFMRRLLDTMQDVGQVDECAELNEQRRMKLTRVVQLLMLQRRNLHQQVEAMHRNLFFLSRRYNLLHIQANAMYRENLLLKNAYPNNNVQPEQPKCDLNADVADEGWYGQENHFLPSRDSDQMYEHDILQPSKELTLQKLTELTDLSVDHSRLKSELGKLQSSDLFYRERCRQLTDENQDLQRRLAESGSSELSKLVIKASQTQDEYANLKRNYSRIHRLYISETENRKLLHNQLQEVKGNLRVICRCRPASSDSQPNDCKLQFGSGERIYLASPSSTLYRQIPSRRSNSSSSSREESFTFNKVFQSDASQLDVFEEIRSLVASCVDGYNVCILAYGPTGSGKTFTMQGTVGQPGVVFRAITELYNLCHPIKAIWNVELGISMLEIYNENIYDLLGDDKVRLVKLSDDGSFIRLIDAEEKQVTSEEDMLKWIQKGRQRRRVTATKLNVESSRSHHIIRIQLRLTSTDKKIQRDSSLIMCDLAGSESAERIDAEGELHVETGYINKSLVTLGRVFDALRRRKLIFQQPAHLLPSSPQHGFNLSRQGHRQVQVAAPYRDSKLTHLLKPCLGGQAKCVLIVTVSGEASKVDRSRKALEFGSQAMQISLGPARPNERILTPCDAGCSNYETGDLFLMKQEREPVEASCNANNDIATDVKVTASAMQRSICMNYQR